MENERVEIWVYMSLGISIGLLFGLPFGMIIGMVIGIGLDKDAEKKGKTIQ